VYINPAAASINTQYSDPFAVLNFIFRAEKYPTDFVGFFGKDLTPTGIIENVNMKSDTCAGLLSVVENYLDAIRIVQPSINGEIVFSESIFLDKVELYDMKGNLVLETLNFNGERISFGMEKGVYLMMLRSNGHVRTMRVLHL